LNTPQLPTKYGAIGFPVQMRDVIALEEVSIANFQLMRGVTRSVE
jgi:hypothetical protein